MPIREAKSTRTIRRDKVQKKKKKKNGSSQKSNPKWPRCQNWQTKISKQIINMFKYLKENMVTINEHVGEISAEKWKLFKKKDIIELKSNLNLKNSLSYLKRKSHTAEKWSLNLKINQYILLNQKKKEKDFQNNK